MKLVLSYFYAGLFLWALSPALLAMECHPLDPDGLSQLKPISGIPSYIRHDVSIELEIYGNDPVEKLLSVLTTRDGTLKDLFSGKGKIPQFEDLARRLDYNSADDLPWDRLTPQQQLDAILAYNFIGKTKKLVVRDVIKVHLSKKTEFLGKTLKPGIHEIPAAKYMPAGSVEIIGIEGNRVYFELHFRARSRASDASNAADRFFQFIGVNLENVQHHQHAHIVADFPLQGLQTDPDILPIQIGFFSELLESIATHIEVLHGGSLFPKIKGHTLHANSSDIEIIPKALFDVARKKKEARSIDFGRKTRLVGFHNTQKYDEQDVWGLQYRALWDDEGGRHRAPRLIFLDAIQNAMETQSWGLNAERARKWRDFMSLKAGKKLEDTEVSAALAHTFWNQDLESLLLRCDPRIQKLLKRRPVILERLRSELAYSDKHKMLLHNWATHPLIFDNPTLVEHIVQIQMKVLQIHFDYKPYVNAPIGSIRQFLHESGLHRLHLNALGLQRLAPADFKHISMFIGSPETAQRQRDLGFAYTNLIEARAKPETSDIEIKNLEIEVEKLKINLIRAIQAEGEGDFADEAFIKEAIDNALLSNTIMP